MRKKKEGTTYNMGKAFRGGVGILVKRFLVTGPLRMQKQGRLAWVTGGKKTRKERSDSWDKAGRWSSVARGKTNIGLFFGPIQRNPGGGVCFSRRKRPNKIIRAAST